MATIVIPDFQYSGHFYPEILEDLIQHCRANVPELTDEDPTEPHIQLLRGFALTGHMNNVLLDLVANEMFLPTAKLRSSHRNLLKLIGVDLQQASPASADLLFQLTRTFSSPVTTIPASSLVATLETRPAPSVEFEALEDLALSLRTDQVGKVYGFDAGGPTYSNHTAEAITPSGNFTVGWGGGGDVEPGDALYIGHPDVMWDKIKVNIATAVASGTIDEGVWEYFDGELNQGNPTSVTLVGGTTLQFNCNSILGSDDRTGTVVRVRSNQTGGFADLEVAYVGGENLIETVAGPNAFLGQDTPSVTATDYIIGTEWRELTNVVDGTQLFTQTGMVEVTYTLPQSLTQNWRKTEVGSGGLAFSAFWIRFRVISVSSGPDAPVIAEVRIHDGKQYQIVEVSQGHSRADNPLGSSDGTGNQEFTFQNLPVIDDEHLRVFVNEGTEYEYSRVDNFLNSVSTDRHFTVDFNDDGAAIIAFGDGTTGKIPPAGTNNIRSTYRTMDEQDGNVGAATITVNRSGIAYITNLTNPRAAAGYAAKEGSTDEDLARLKIAGPASLRTRERAVSTEDVESVATTFVADDGSRPVKRALAVEEAFGPKTVECIVVGAGGALVDSSKLEEIEDFFNGTDTVKGKLVMNHEATVSNFTQRAIDVTATVTGGNLSAILTALTGLLNPLAIDEDGTYRWDFGGLVPLAKINQIIMDTSPAPSNCIITTPPSDVDLGDRELPVVGTLSITVVD